MDNFKPTWLMIKRHTVTGLKYFCKTVKISELEALKYKGSGKVWLNHIRKYGFEHVVTDWYQLFTDKEECKNFALKFSQENNIVKSKDWANLIEENGLDGGNRNKRTFFTKEHKEKLSVAAKNRKRNHKQSIETRQKISLANKNKTKTFEHREKLRIINLGKKHTQETRLKMRGKRGTLKNQRKPRKTFLICQSDLNGNVIQTGKVKDFVNLGFSKSRISECCNNKISKYKGFLWKKIDYCY